MIMAVIGVIVVHMVVARMVLTGVIPGSMVVACVVVIGMALSAVLLAMRIVLTWMIHGRTLFIMIAFCRRGANGAPHP